MAAIRWNRRALADLSRNAETRRFLKMVGNRVRDEARDNARPIVGPHTNRLTAIVTDEPAEDAEGAYIDVGYNRDDPGFDLWWTEIGTVEQPAQPHLRPALRPGLF